MSTDDLSPHQRLEQALKSAMPEILAQRDEVLRAFIAKYKCQPDEAVQICQYDGTGKWTWRIDKRHSRHFATGPKEE